MAVDERHRADAVFEGGGVKGIAFAGAIAAAERDAGVQEWVNVAGTSAGSIVAALLVAGYDAAGIQELLAKAIYSRFADTGAGGKWVGGLGNAVFRLRGMAPGRYFLEWMSEQLAASPLAKELGKTELTFADVRRRDLPPKQDVPDITDEQYERAKYRLHVIGSDVTTGRMIIVPDDLPDYADEAGKAFDKDSFPLVEAVRMSMSYPFLFSPVELHREGKPVYVVDGGTAVELPHLAVRRPAPEAADLGVPAARRHERRRGIALPEDPASVLGGAAPEGDVLGGHGSLGSRADGAGRFRADGFDSHAPDQHHGLRSDEGRGRLALRVGCERRPRLLHRPGRADLHQLVRKGARADDARD